VSKVIDYLVVTSTDLETVVEQTRASLKVAYVLFKKQIYVNVSFFKRLLCMRMNLWKFL